MEILHLLNIKIPILQLKTLSDGNLAIIDAQTSVRIVSVESYRVIDGFKSNVNHERYTGSEVDISLCGHFSISTVPGKNKAALFSVPKRELICKLGRHSGDIESVAIDPNSRYGITCGQDGKVVAWVLKTARLAFSLPSHADFVTTVAFNDSGHWVATGSFDRTINLLNIATMKNPKKLRGHNSVVVKIVFLPDVRLLSAEKEGGLILWDIRSGNIVKRLSKMNDEITAMCTTDDKRFLFVGTQLGYVGLYNLETMELVRANYLKEGEGISSLAFIGNGYRIAVGTIEGNVRFYSLYGDEQKYMELLHKRRYREFYTALEENPFLLYSRPYAVIELIWEDTLAKAKHYLEKGESEKAKSLFLPFEGIPKKKSLIKHILHEYEKYAQFQAYTQEGRFALAYSMAKQYPIFQETEPYRKMEMHWKKLFTKAQELILGSNGEEQARKVLSPYRGISEKTVLIQQLFADKRIYEYFKRVIVSRDFVKFFDLIRIHPFLKEFAEYTTVLEYADKLYIKAQKAYQNGEFSVALKGCEVLIHFPDYHHEAHEMMETIKAKHLFFDAITAKNMVNAFAYLDTYPLLYETAEAQLLERQWNETVDKAQRYAARGMVEDVRKTFKGFQSISAKFTAMASVYAQCYQVQLENKLRADSPQSILERGIGQYVRFFGIDEGITLVFNFFKNKYESELELEGLEEGDLNNWSPSMIVKEIGEERGAV
ncbi:MAG: hypothetical protein M0P91_06775 [Sulfuricurvum sp.]|jgi:hypothetical protein|uniref:WD40 repeat domain-containing protein n=1 Tax=Sulfuricurvum sp. TaxID=2025608 RepID=UPI0025FE8239|nr:hypothetical protein [Sulfuricurvum sp.]MCK9372884.1 hypothetical protein [Sulfuricurvum sp.]